jgi:hypothetical protein
MMSVVTAAEMTTAAEEEPDYRTVTVTIAGIGIVVVRSSIAVAPQTSTAVKVPPMPPATAITAAVSHRFRG